MGRLVHPDVEIHTARTVHRGREAAVEWSGKAYEHLVRRFIPVEIEPRRRGVLVHAELQYVWRASEEVGDLSEVMIELGIRDGLISSWWLLEDSVEAQAGEDAG